jgi:hypothetical protein
MSVAKKDKQRTGDKPELLGKIKQDLAENLPAIDRLLKETAKTSLTGLEKFLESVVRGAGKFLESPFKQEEESG